MAESFINFRDDPLNRFKFSSEDLHPSLKRELEREIRSELSRFDLKTYLPRGIKIKEATTLPTPEGTAVLGSMLYNYQLSHSARLRIFGKIDLDSQFEAAKDNVETGIKKMQADDSTHLSDAIGEYKLTDNTALGHHSHKIANKFITKLYALSVFSSLLNYYNLQNLTEARLIKAYNSFPHSVKPEDVPRLRPIANLLAIHDAGYDKVLFGLDTDRRNELLDKVLFSSDPIEQLDKALNPQDPKAQANTSTSTDNLTPPKLNRQERRLAKIANVLGREWLEANQDQTTEMLIQLGEQALIARRKQTTKLANRTKTKVEPKPTISPEQEPKLAKKVYFLSSESGRSNAEKEVSRLGAVGEKRFRRQVSEYASNGLRGKHYSRDQKGLSVIDMDSHRIYCFEDPEKLVIIRVGHKDHQTIDRIYAFQQLQGISPEKLKPYECSS